MIGNYQKMVAFIRRVEKHTCCLCEDCCMACDAKVLLDEIGETKIAELEAMNYKPAESDGA